MNDIKNNCSHCDRVSDRLTDINVFNEYNTKIFKKTELCRKCFKLVEEAMKVGEKIGSKF